MKHFTYSLLSIVVITMLCYSCGHDNEGSDPATITGKLIGHSNCKSSKSDSVFMILADSISCAFYDYDSANNQLTIDHINAGFNCCPDSLYCQVSMHDDTIVVREFEKANNCNCDCLYDLKIEVNNIEPRPYQIKFIEPYAVNQEQLLFGVDFSKQAQGSYCVNRTIYPWKP